MNFKLRQKLTYSNVIASIALFVALGGAAVAAGLPKGSVGPKQLKHGAVTAGAIRKAAVTSGKLAPKSVIAGKLGPNAVLPGNIGNGAITSAKLGGSSVIASTIKNGVVTTNKLANANVTTAKLADGSVTAAKLAKGVLPSQQQATLSSKQTERGSFEVGGFTTLALAGISYPLPLAFSPEGHILGVGENSPQCPGRNIKSGQQVPEASAGHLCLYVALSGGESPTLGFTNGNSNLGYGLSGTFSSANPANRIFGFWAVTAP